LAGFVSTRNLVQALFRYSVVFLLSDQKTPGSFTSLIVPILMIWTNDATVVDSGYVTSSWVTLL